MSTTAATNSNNTTPLSFATSPRSSLRSRTVGSPLARHDPQGSPRSFSNAHNNRLHNSKEQSYQQQGDEASTSQSVDSATNVNNNLSQSELEDLKCAFNLLDTNKQGEISSATLRGALTKHKTKTAGSKAHPALARLDAWIQQDGVTTSGHATDNDHYLNFDDFLQILTDPDPADQRTELRKVFDLFDVDGKNYVNVRDLYRVAHDLGESMSMEELEEMVARAEATNGQVTFELFEAIMNKPMFD